MSDIHLTLQITALVVLLVLSACFSMSETVMMAANRYRLRSLAAVWDAAGIRHRPIS